MSRRMLVDATHDEETRMVVVEENKVEEFDYDSTARRRAIGNIYLARVTRVEPSLQAAFIEYGGGRHGFLPYAEIHPDYYQIPVADRDALLAEEQAYSEALRKREEAAGATAANSRPDGDINAVGAADTAGAHSAEASENTAPQSADLDEGMDGNGTIPSDASAVAVEGEAALVETSNDEARADDEADDAQALKVDLSEEIPLPRRPKRRGYRIQEVIKARQILLVQVVREERGNKGAALTTYISLAGRYCVLMPNTTRGSGVSRKINKGADRKKLKAIAENIEVPPGTGLIIRTAGADRTKSEIKRDYEYLQRLWEQIREQTLISLAPVQIYEEANLIRRSIRDLYSREISEVLVEGEAGYRVAKDFMKMIMPSHARHVKQYEDPIPLFSRYGVEDFLDGMFSPTVKLKSGGYIVIGITEALVAIDVNSGRATGQGSIEETAFTTNIEAAEEVARQLRLRDLAGLIVIDFIDMANPKHNQQVRKHLADRLKPDRARIHVGRISGFGLLEMSRQRMRIGMIENSTQACRVCRGTGLVRSDESTTFSILRQIQGEAAKAKGDLCLRVSFGVGNILLNAKRAFVTSLERRYGISIMILVDPELGASEYALEQVKSSQGQDKAASKVIAAKTGRDLEDSSNRGEAPEGGDRSEGRRRGNRRRRSSGDGTAVPQPKQEELQTSEATSDATGVNAADGAGAPSGEADEQAEQPPALRTRRRSRRGGRGRSRRRSGESKPDEDGNEGISKDNQGEVSAQAEAVVDADNGPEATTPRDRDDVRPDSQADGDVAAVSRRRVRRRTARKPASAPKCAPGDEDAGGATAPAPATTEEAGDVPKSPSRRRSSRSKPTNELPVDESLDSGGEGEDGQEGASRRRSWWSRGARNGQPTPATE